MDDEVKSLQSRLENQEIEAKALAYLHGQVVDERDALRAQNAGLLAALEQIRVLAVSQKSPVGIAPSGIAWERDRGLSSIVGLIDAAIYAGRGGGFGNRVAGRTEDTEIEI